MYKPHPNSPIPAPRGAHGAGMGLLSLHPIRHGIHLNLLYHGQQTV